MFDWVILVLTSEFVWGIAFGIALSTFSAFATFHLNKFNQSRTIKRFLLDTINNIESLSLELSDNRDRNKVIDNEFLDLIDVEVNIFGRNREHLSALEDDELRKNAREYITRTASLVARIRIHLKDFYKSHIPMNEITYENRILSEQSNEIARIALNNAHISCDRLRELATTRAPSLKSQLR